MVFHLSSIAQSGSDELHAVLQQTQEHLGAYLKGEHAIERLQLSFGGGASEPSTAWLERAQAFLAELAAGSRSVAVELRSPEELQGAHGAFAANGPSGEAVILLRADWATSLGAAGLLRVLLEETGHWIDSQLNGRSDTPGDEGQLFAARVLDLPLDAPTIAAISQEDDSAVLQLNGQAIVVEFNGSPDTDGDGIADAIDLDDDNDGILDTVESQLSTPPALTPASLIFSYAQNTLGFNSFHNAASPTIYKTGDKNDPANFFDGNIATELRIHQNDIYEFKLPSAVSAGSSFTLIEGTGSNDKTVAVLGSLGSTDATGNTGNAAGAGLGWKTISAAFGVSSVAGLKTKYDANQRTAGNLVLLYVGLSGGLPNSTISFNTPINIDHIQLVGLETHGGWADLKLSAAVDVGLDTDGDGIPNSRDLDSDNDGISDLAESVGWDPSANAMKADTNRDGTNRDGTITRAEAAALMKVNESQADANNNGLWDFLEPGGTATGTTPVDTDKDGVADVFDLDSDNDGIPDTVELQTTSGYSVNDGDVRNEDADGDGVIARFDNNDASGGTTFGGSFATPVNTDASGEATSGGLVDEIRFVTADYWKGSSEYKVSSGTGDYKVLATRSTDNTIDDSDGYAKIKYNTKAADNDVYVVDFGQQPLSEGTEIRFSAANNSDATIANPDQFTVKKVSDSSGTDVSGTTQTYSFTTKKGIIADFTYVVRSGGLRWLEFENTSSNDELRLDYVAYTGKKAIGGTPIPDYLDRDSDGDGILDRDEGVNTPPANPTYQDPDGTIAGLDPSANPFSTLQNTDANGSEVDYRSLNTDFTVGNVQVNEASPYAVFTISNPGNGGSVKLALETTGTGDRHAAIEPSGNDIKPTLQYRASDGGDWTTYSGDSLIAVPSNGTLLVRVAVNNDFPAVYEGAETFRLAVRDSSNNIVDPSGGIGTILDDGSGNIWLASNLSSDPNVVDGSGNKLIYDDDRKLVTINDLTINEGDGTAATPRYAVFTLTGNPGQTVSLDLSGNTATEWDGSGSVDLTGGNTDFGGSKAIRYQDASGIWQDYSSGSVSLDASGSLRVGVAIYNDNLLENSETFQLIASYTNYLNQAATAIGTGTIRDDGQGLLWDASGNLDVTTELDDDSPINIGDLIVNEGSSWAVLDLEGKANQSYTLTWLDQTSTGSELTARFWDGSGAADASGGTTDFGGSVPIQYFDTSSNQWQNYDPNQGIKLDTSGHGEIRVGILNDILFEGASGETFRIVATSNGVTSTGGLVTIRDDGTGTFFDASGNINEDAAKDDDRNPIAVDNTYTTDEDKIISGNIILDDADGSGDTTGIDTDSQNRSLSIATINGQQFTALTDSNSSTYSAAQGWKEVDLLTGTLFIKSDGTFDYIPDANASTGTNTPDSFTYTVTNQNNESQPATVSLTVQPVNDPPLINANGVLVTDDFVREIPFGNTTDPGVTDRPPVALMQPGVTNLADVDSDSFQSLSLTVLASSIQDGTAEKLVITGATLTSTAVPVMIALAPESGAYSGTVAFTLGGVDYTATLGEIADPSSATFRTISFSRAAANTLIAKGEAEGLLDALAYTNAAPTPTTSARRTFELTATDDLGAISNATEVVITLGNGPVIDLDGDGPGFNGNERNREVTFTENGDPADNGVAVALATNGNAPGINLQPLYQSASYSLVGEPIVGLTFNNDGSWTYNATAVGTFNVAYRWQDSADATKFGNHFFTITVTGRVPWSGVNPEVCDLIGDQ